MKRVLKIVVPILLVLVLLATILFRRIESKREIAEAHLQAQFGVWDAMLARLQHDLPVGTPRAEVKRYLDSEKFAYSEEARITVNLGRVPGDGFACDYWSAHLSFEFRRLGEAGKLPDAKLNGISLKKFGHCL
jgi:hypothetical protein